MSKHTPEPWEVRDRAKEFALDTNHWHGICSEHKPTFWVAQVEGFGPQSWADAHRIAACVNALAGVDDPAAFVARAAAAEEECKRLSMGVAWAAYSRDTLARTIRDYDEAQNDAERGRYAAPMAIAICRRLLSLIDTPPLSPEGNG